MISFVSLLLAAAWFYQGISMPRRAVQQPNAELLAPFLNYKSEGMRQRDGPIQFPEGGFDETPLQPNGTQSD